MIDEEIWETAFEAATAVLENPTKENKAELSKALEAFKGFAFTQFELNVLELFDDINGTISNFN